uniref:Sperm flagellar 2 n=1 Tax=Pseudonaja textilis TaxID=8673 RepID=A0A670YFN1_PSETE
ICLGILGKSFAREFSSGYLIGELLNKYELQEDFDQFSQSRLANAKLNNFSRMEPTLQLLGVQFDQNVARNIMTEQHGAAIKLVYQLYVALEKKKKAGLTGVAMDAMRPSANAKLKSVGTEIYLPRQADLSLQQISESFQNKVKILESKMVGMQFVKQQQARQIQEEKKKIAEKRRQNEIMAKIQAAVIQIPKPLPQHTDKAIEDQKLQKKKKEAEVSYDMMYAIKQAQELATTKPVITELLNTYSDDEYIRKIQKRLEEDTFAREQREKRRRKMLREQLIAHEAQEEAYREEQLVNRLMRQSQQERRIAVQLMHVRHEKEVLWQNRIYREKQFEERRLKEFQEALDREEALAKQEKIELAEQALREKQLHAKLAAERAEARYKKHYEICWEVVEQIIDLATKIGEYRTLTNNLIPAKLMRDWKELFLKGKPIYEQADISNLPDEPTPEQLVELDKINLLDEKDYDEYKAMVEEWYPPEEIRVNKPPPDNVILGHVIHRLMELVYPPDPEPPPSIFSPFPMKGCILGKLYSGKTTCLNFLGKVFNIQVLSLDALIEEAIKSFHENETVVESLLPARMEGSSLNQIQVSKTWHGMLSIRAQLGAAAETLLKKGKNIPDELLVGIMVEAIRYDINICLGWIMDGFPMTLNQAKLLEKALTGRDPDQTETNTINLKKPTLVTDPAAPKEPPVRSPGLDFAILLDVTDSIVMNRIATEKVDSYESEHKTTAQISQTEIQEREELKSAWGQMQHRIIGFLDAWPQLEDWYSEQQNILIKVNADIEKSLMCQRIKEILTGEIIKIQTEFLVPYWETIEKTYINNIKATLRCLRDEQHVIIYYLSDIRNHFKDYLKRPDHKQEFVTQWQVDYNSVTDDLWDDDETKEELHQRVTDLRDRLWDICENRRDEAEQERCDIMNDGWLPDRIGLLMNHIFSLMQNEMDRFQDTKRVLHDYYRAMEGKIPIDTSSDFTRIPLIDLMERRIPTIAHISPSPEVNRERIKLIPVKLKDDLFSESVIFNFSPDEKLLTETWHHLTTTISSVMPGDRREKQNVCMMLELWNQVPTIFKIAEAAKSRLELLKVKGLAFLEDLQSKAEETYRNMEKWLGERYLAEMSSVDKLVGVARNHIETSSRIQFELALEGTDFYVNGDIKVFEDPTLPPRPPSVETATNSTLTISQLSTLHKQFLQVAPKGKKILFSYIKKVTPGKQSYSEKSHQFPNIWMLKYTWLKYDSDKGIMYCALCRKHNVDLGEKTHNFCSGTDDFILELVDEHNNSEAHAWASCMETASSSTPDSGTTQQMLKNMSKTTLKKIENLFRTCHAIAKTGRPFTDLDWISKLDDMKGVDIGSIFRNDKAARIFIHFIAEVERRALKEKLEKCKFFSLISDGITDSGTTEAALVYIQFAHQGKTHCQIVGIQSIDMYDALTVKNAILKTLQTNLKVNLPTHDWAKKLVGFGSDGRDVMIGEDGVAKLLKDIQPCIQSIHCLVHRLEMAYKMALKNTPLFNILTDLLKNLYYFYHDSPMNKKNLKLICEAHKMTPVVPSRIGGSQWFLRLQTALQILLKGYPAIALHLREESDSSNQQKAKDLLKFLLKTDMVKFSHFLLDVINVLNILSRVAHNPNTSIADVFATIQSTLEILQMYQKRSGPRERLVETITYFHGYPLVGDGNISATRLELLSSLLNQLQDCFCDASEDVLIASAIGSFKLWPDKFKQEFGETEVSLLIQHYEPILEWAKVKVDEIETEWNMLKAELYNRYENIQGLTWDLVNRDFFHKYPNVLALIDLLLTLPASSSEAARGFGQMKLTMMRLRSKLMFESMTDLMVIQLNSPEINKFNPQKAVQLWNYRSCNGHWVEFNVFCNFCISDTKHVC